jgi:hypothetical protein
MCQKKIVPTKTKKCTHNNKKLYTQRKQKFVPTKTKICAHNNYEGTTGKFSRHFFEQNKSAKIPVNTTFNNVDDLAALLSSIGVDHAVEPERRSETASAFGVSTGERVQSTYGASRKVMSFNESIRINQFIIPQ